MRLKHVLGAAILGLGLIGNGGSASAQDATPIASQNDIYCSGVVTSEAVPTDTFVITGEEGMTTLEYSGGDVVYLNKGAKQGISVGEVFSVIRPSDDPGRVEFTKWQQSILRKMGTVWEDEGRLVVISVLPTTSIARVDHPCGTIQRGDIVLPFMERPVPPLKSGIHFDPYLPANGKPLAMVITGKGFATEVGVNDVVYVNLGNQQGVKTGDFFRVFRYTGQHNEVAFQEPRFAFNVEKSIGPTFGLGGVSKAYTWSNTPREDIGEGVVLRTGPNSATVLITFSKREIFAGDYVEVE
jgi:hypothetical protein